MGRADPRTCSSTDVTFRSPSNIKDFARARLAQHAGGADDAQPYCDRHDRHHAPGTGSFDDKTIDLLQTFADQAVIAIENVRLFEEQRARDLGAAAAADRHRRRAQGDQPLGVRPADGARALRRVRVQALEADYGTILLRGWRRFGLRTTQLRSPKCDRTFRELSDNAGSRLDLRTNDHRGPTVHVPDVLADPEYNRPARKSYGHSGRRFGVPLVREGEPRRHHPVADRGGLHATSRSNWCKPSPIRR